MDLTTWHDDVGLPQMHEWLAELRDEGYAEPAVERSRWPQAGAAPADPAAALPQAIVPPQARAPWQASAGAATTERAAIGDQLRRPMMWCEIASCISYHADPAALGEADARARAIRAGWRIDGLGRLACPRCQQTASFWTSRPVVRWDRDAAVMMALLATVRGSRRCGNQAEPARHHEYPGRPRHARQAASTLTPASRVASPVWR